MGELAESGGCAYEPHTHTYITTARKTMLSFNVARFIVALPLILGAALKAYALGVDPAPGTGWLDWRVTQIFLVLLEAAVGVWLLGGWNPRELRLCALMLYAVLAVASLYFALSGDSYCPCFGLLRINPWVSLTVNTVAIGLLLTSSLPLRERFKVSKSFEASIGPMTLRWFAFASMILIGAGVVAQSVLRPPPDVFHLVRIEPTIHHLGPIEQFQEVTRSFRINNNLDQPIILTNVISNCGCTTVPGLTGRIIQAKAFLDLPVTLKTGESRGRREGTITIYYRAIAQTLSAWKRCTLSGDVQTDYEVTPMALDFGTTEEDRPIVRSLRFVARHLADARIVSLSTTNSQFTARLLDEGSKRSEKEVEVVFRPHRTTQAECFSAFLEIATNSYRLPRRRVLLQARFVPPEEVWPQYIVVGSDELGTVRRKIRLRAQRPMVVRLACSSLLVQIPIHECEVLGSCDVDVVIGPVEKGHMLNTSLALEWRPLSGTGETRRVIVPIDRFSTQ